MSKPYTYVLVREDIPAHQQMVQACHAALEAGFAFEKPDITSRMIILTVPDKEALLHAQKRLEKKGIRSTIFFEPDWDMGESALASEPIIDRSKRFAMKKYPLYAT